MNNFFWFRFNKGEPLWVENNFSSSDIAKIVYLGLYIDNKNNLIFNNNVHINKENLSQLYDLSTAKFNVFFNILIKENVFYFPDDLTYKEYNHILNKIFYNDLQLNKQFIRKGAPNSHWEKQKYGCHVQIFEEALKDLYDTDISYHYIGYIFKLIPFLNFKNNNISIKQMGEVLQYNSSQLSKLCKILIQLKHVTTDGINIQISKNLINYIDYKNEVDNMIDKYSVYMHISPSNKYYIGITKLYPSIRWGKNGRNYKENQYFWNAIQKYGWDNFEHKIIYTGLSQEEAIQKEIELIQEYRSNDVRFGYNLTGGGESNSNIIRQTYTEERRQNAKENENVQVIWGKHKKTNKTAKPILQYDMYGNFINRYSSLTSASRRMNCYWSKIWECCEKIIPHINEYFFFYEESFDIDKIDFKYLRNQMKDFENEKIQKFIKKHEKKNKKKSMKKR